MIESLNKHVVGLFSRDRSDPAAYAKRYAYFLEKENYLFDLKVNVTFKEKVFEGD